MHVNYLVKLAFNKLLGIHVLENLNNKVKAFDISNYNTMVFDEIFLYNPYQLSMIDKFIKNNDKKNFFATGDIMQLKSFGYPLNNIDNKYIN